MEREEDMTTKLEWKIGSLWLGRIEVARTEWTSRSANRYRVAGHEWSIRYEDATDCQNDCESEVRRLLEEAGVEVMS